MVSEDMFFLCFRSTNSIIDVHASDLTANDEAKSYLMHRDLMDGYHYMSEETSRDGSKTIVLVKMFGILRRVINISKKRVHG